MLLDHARVGFHGGERAFVVALLFVNAAEIKCGLWVLVPVEFDGAVEVAGGQVELAELFVEATEMEVRDGIACAVLLRHDAQGFDGFGAALQVDQRKAQLQIRGRKVIAVAAFDDAAVLFDGHFVFALLTRCAG